MSQNPIVYHHLPIKISTNWIKLVHTHFWAKPFPFFAATFTRHLLALWLAANTPESHGIVASLGHPGPFPASSDQTHTTSPVVAINHPQWSIFRWWYWGNMLKSSQESGSTQFRPLLGWFVSGSPSQTRLWKSGNFRNRWTSNQSLQGMELLALAWYVPSLFLGQTGY